MTRDRSSFGPLADALTGLLERIGGATDPVLEVSVGLLLSAVERGHTYLDLVDAAGKTLGQAAPEACPEGMEGEVLPTVSAWRTALERMGVVGAPGSYAPLILEPADRLYLHRYWVHERTVAQAIRSRLEVEEDAVAPADLRATLDRLFPSTGDGQRAAAALAALRRFAVVSGGPGTGKTHTLLRIIALIAWVERGRGRSPRIALAAPTGKAAARLGESVRAGREGLRRVFGDLVDLIPTEASTIHRLLGFRYAGRDTVLLPVDLVVVDESSMVDISLMASLVKAMPTEARLVLAGDHCQLSSVEAGVVLGDICDTGTEHGYPPATARVLQVVCPGLEISARQGEPRIAGCIAVLRRNYRTEGAGELESLAQATNRGDADEVLRLLGRGGRVTLRPWSTERELEGFVAEAVLPWFRDLRATTTPEELFAAYGRQIVLCAVRKGPGGVESMNRGIRTTLERAGLARRRPSGDGSWFPGLPVSITVNDYATRLWNGDICIAPTATGPAPAQTTGAVVVSPHPEGGYRQVSTARLPAHEPAFALTVHKCQGSEFQRVVLVLPAAPTPILTRELFYTAITRARSEVVVLGTPQIVRHTVEHRTRRRSGLRDLLWAP